MNSGMKQGKTNPEHIQKRCDVKIDSFASKNSDYPNKCLQCGQAILTDGTRSLSATKKKKYCNPVCYHKHQSTENQIRIKSIKRYNKNPNMCLHCNQPITVNENQNVSSVRNKVFCNNDCYNAHQTARNYEKNLSKIGQKFNRLTTIAIRKHENNALYLCLCKCDCGVESLVRADQLENGLVKSCGCLQKEIVSQLGKNRRLANGEASLNNLIRAYKKGATKRDLTFELTREKLLDLFSSNCSYCGKEPSQIVFNDTKENSEGYIYTGIDRIDNTLGYTNENVRPACKTCNMLKYTYDLSDFLNHITQIAVYLDLLAEKRPTFQMNWNLNPEISDIPKKLIAAYKKAANNRDLAFTLSDKHLLVLLQSACSYCGNKPSNSFHATDYIYTGIDRIDNTKGYVESNVRSACIICNRMKMTLSLDKFEESVKSIVVYLNLLQ